MVAQFLQQKFGSAVTVEGGNYPPPPVVEMIGNLLWIAQGLGIAWLTLGGDRILNMLGLARTDAHNRLILPAWYYQVHEYRVQIGIFLYLLLPQLLSKYMVTGAFEIYLNDRQVWSKIAEGRFPTEEEIVRVLAAAGLKHA